MTRRGAAGDCPGRCGRASWQLRPGASRRSRGSRRTGSPGPASSDPAAPSRARHRVCRRRMIWPVSEPVYVSQVPACRRLVCHQRPSRQIACAPRVGSPVRASTQSGADPLFEPVHVHVVGAGRLRWAVGDDQVRGRGQATFVQPVQGVGDGDRVEGGGEAVEPAVLVGGDGRGGHVVPDRPGQLAAWLVAGLDDQVQAELAGEGGQVGEPFREGGRRRGRGVAADVDEPRVPGAAGQGGGFQGVPFRRWQVRPPLVGEQDGQLLERPVRGGDVADGGGADLAGEVQDEWGEVEGGVAVLVESRLDAAGYDTGGGDGAGVEVDDGEHELGAAYSELAAVVAGLGDRTDALAEPAVGVRLVGCGVDVVDQEAVAASGAPAVDQEERRAGAVRALDHRRVRGDRVCLLIGRSGGCSRRCGRSAARSAVRWSGVARRTPGVRPPARPAR